MKKKETVNIGANIKRIRKEKGMSQHTLSVLSRIPQQTLSNIERNPNHKPSVQLVMMIAKGLDVQIEELIRK